MARRCEFTQAVANHVFGHIDRNMPVTVVYCDGMTDHLWKNRAIPAPGANYLLVTLSVHGFDLRQKFGIAEWTFFK